MESRSRNNVAKLADYELRPGMALNNNRITRMNLLEQIRN